MTGLVTLAVRHAAHHWGRTGVLAACLAILVSIPVASRWIGSAFEANLRSRAETVPLVVGAKGSRYDLVFSALAFRATDLAPTPMRLYEEIRDRKDAEAIPLHARFTARGVAVLGTSFEYLERRGLRVEDGRAFARLGEAVLGSGAARRLGLGPGDTLISDQRRSYDITAPSSVELRIAGVLAKSGTPDDDIAIVDLETAWVLEGIAHGHDDAKTIERPDLLIGKSDEHVALSGAVITYQEVTDLNAASFHIHGSRDELPLSAILVYPRDDKARTILSTQVNASPGHQAIVPVRVVDDLMAFVVRIQSLLDGLSLVLGVSTLALLGLIVWLTARAREDEIRTLREIGCSRGAVAGLFVIEIGATMAVGVAGGIGLAWLIKQAAGGFLPFM